MISGDGASSDIVLLGAGDCGPVHGPADGFPLEGYSALVQPVLSTADIRFGNCERQYSARKAPQGKDVHGCAPPEMAEIFTNCGFDAVTLANNHMYDHGPEALLDTRSLFLGKGIQVTGAGKDLDEARQPAIVERKGVRVGFLGYCSFLPDGGAADINKAGIAPLRFSSTYEQTRYKPEGLLTQTMVRTQVNDQDLRMVLDDISALRKRVDIVIVAFHWGVIWVPRVIAEYQVVAARACVDAGADLILGHHPHVPKAIEVYKGKGIFYSLGLFCMTKKPSDPHVSWTAPPWMHGALRNHTDLDPEYPFMPYGKDSKRALLAKATMSKSGIKSLSFIPMIIDRKYRPEPLQEKDPRFPDMVRYMEWASEGFEHKFVQQGNEVLVQEG